MISRGIHRVDTLVGEVWTFYEGVNIVFTAPMCRISPMGGVLIDQTKSPEESNLIVSYDETPAFPGLLSVQ